MIANLTVSTHALHVVLELALDHAHLGVVILLKHVQFARVRLAALLLTVALR